MRAVQGCVFCSIVAGETAAVIVYADDAVMAFLDARPVFAGHTLVVPLRHHETLTDLPAADVGPFFARVQMLTRAVQRGMGADGVFVGMNNTVSQSVPHLHAHVVPRRRKDGLRGFFWPRTRYADADEQEAVRAAIAKEAVPID
jgi:histidine triad (HIT) family protein